MRKKRLRGGNDEHGGEPTRNEQGERTTRPARRTARVRNRLVLSVAVVSIAVAAAGAPAIAAAIDQTHDSQRLVDLARTNREAVVLAHSLADERDAMTEFVAAGRSSASGAGVSEDQRARVDRRIGALRGDVPGALRRLLDDLPRLRQQALTGRGSALDVARKYTETVQALQDLAGTLARRMPERADTGSAAALASLGRANEQASATRGLLLGALAADGGQPGLTEAAQRGRIREQAAVADFEQLAPADVRERFTRTVNGTEVTTAERQLDRLTDDAELSGTDLLLETERVGAILTARIDRMRGVESALATAEVDRLEQLRDDDVTDLEIHIALVAACLLVALGAGVSAARSMTRPLAALRLGARRVAADPVAEEPVEYRGRDDEFAEAVRSVNELREAARREHERAAKAEADRARVVGERRRLADERTELRRERDEIAARLDGLRARVHGSFVSLALRNLGLIERQLAVIEGLEEREQDPDRLETLFQLDHLATGMRRYSENLLVIAGSENKATHPGPVPLLDVLRAAISEVERYDRVQIQSLPPHTHVAGFAADSMSHLVAELLENATTFSPPDSHVQLSGWLLETGELLLSVQDEGIGMTPARFDELNERLAEPVPDYCQGPNAEDPLGLGLYVVTRLAARHGVQVQLREQQQGGVAAVVILPTKILPAPPAGAVPEPAPARPAAGGAPAGGPGLPGSAAEANSDTLTGHARSRAARPGEPGTDRPEPVRPEGRPAAEEAIPRTRGPWAADGPAETGDPAGAVAPAAPDGPHADGEPDFVPDIEVDVAPGVDPLVAAAERTIQLAALRGDLRPNRPEPAAPGDTAERSGTQPGAGLAEGEQAPGRAAAPGHPGHEEPADHAPAAGPETGDGYGADGYPRPGGGPADGSGAPSGADTGRDGGHPEPRSGTGATAPGTGQGHPGPASGTLPAAPADDRTGGPLPGGAPESGAPVAGHAWSVPRAAEDPSRSPGPALPRRPRRSSGPDAGRDARPSFPDPEPTPPDGTPAAGVAWRQPGDPAAPGGTPAPSAPPAPEENPAPEARREAGADGHDHPADRTPPPLPSRPRPGRAARRSPGADDWPGATPAAESVPDGGRSGGAPGATGGTVPGPAGQAARGPAAEATPAAGLPRRKPAAAGDPAPDGPAAPQRRLTDKGLPKRTPRTVARPAPAGRERARGVNAEELRRRLGGFQQGAREGRRDAEAEAMGGRGDGTGPQDDVTARRDAREGRPEPAAQAPRVRGQAGPRHRPGPHPGAQDEAGTVEEARD